MLAVVIEPLNIDHSTIKYLLVPHAQLSLAKFKSLAGWLNRLPIQTTNVQLIVFSCKNQGTIVHFDIILKTHIAVFLCESTISRISVSQPAQLAC